MKIEKLPSGTYRIRKTVNKKTYSFFFDDKPTKRDIEEQLAKLFIKNGGKSVPIMFFKIAGINYIESKSNILSQSTIREYYRKLYSLPEWFLSMDINNLNHVLIQSMINDYSLDHSPKSVRDLNGFVTAVLGFHGIKIYKSINLPQKIKHEPYCPTDEEVRQILKEAEGTMFECAIGLAICGLRRSEICCITADDIHDDIVTVNKALVENRDKEWVIKTTKTTESTREVPIPHSLAQKIIEQGKAYDGFPGSISNWLKATQKKLKMNSFSLHMLRHYFASKLFEKFSKRDVEILGGWEKNSQVLESIYTQSMLARSAAGRKEIMDTYTKDLF